MFLAPNGKLFFAGPQRVQPLHGHERNGHAGYTGPSSNYGTRSYGPAVYLDGRVLLIGGGDPPTATVEMIDLNVASPVWRYMAPDERGAAAAQRDAAAGWNGAGDGRQPRQWLRQQ